MSKMGRKVNDVSSTVQFYLLFVQAYVKPFDTQGNLRVPTDSQGSSFKKLRVFFCFSRLLCLKF